MSKKSSIFSLGMTALAGALLALPTSAKAQGPAGPPMFGGITDMGKTMADNGIYFDLLYIEDLSVLLSGGFKTGGNALGLARPSIDFDLEKILGLKGSSFHIGFDERNGIPANNGGGIGGAAAPMNGIGGPVQIRLWGFYWQQALADDQVEIKIGRWEPTFDFGFDPQGCNFISSIYCTETGSWYYSSNNGATPSAEWGGDVKVKLTKEISIMAGVFQDSPYGKGFLDNGFDWSFKSNSSLGVFIPVELVYQTGFSDVQLPARYALGGYDDTSTYGAPGSTTGAVNHGRQALWLQANQTVWRPNRATKQSLALQAGATFYNGGAPYQAQYYAGFSLTAPFASRPGDQLNAVGSLYQVNQAMQPAKAQEYAFEINYQAAVIPGVTFQPFLQYVINPFDSTRTVGYQQPTSANYAGKIAGNEFIIGAQFVIDLAGLFGWPAWPGATMGAAMH